MSDQWIFFPCQMGEHRAYILYDHGIRDSIDTIAVRRRTSEIGGDYDGWETPVCKASG
jgi:hypothetical protein